VLEQLSERLQGVLHPLNQNKTLTLNNMEEALREIRRAFLEADVSLRVIKGFLSRVQEQAEGQNVLKAVNPSQQLTKIVHDELVTLLGSTHQPLTTEGNPAVIMLFGLQGSGKTTTAGKLANKLKKDGKNPFLIAADVYRPAAINQLITLGQQVDVPVHHLPGNTNVPQIVTTGLQLAKDGHHDVVVIDTAGRLQVDTDMMAELLLVERLVQPQEKLLVIDAMTGQEAVNVAEAFNTQLDVTGIVMTKLDGDTRGGAALSVVAVTQKPIKLIGVSEKMEGLEAFHPDRMAGRILGMGDVVSLVEKAQQLVDETEAAKLEEKIRKQTFTFDDFLKIQKQLSMLGGLEGILNLLPIPGIDKNMKEMLSHGGEKQMKRVNAMIQSMTAEERGNADLMQNDKRIKRVAQGCGIPLSEVQAFVRQFEQMKLVMKQLTRFKDDQQKEASLQAPRTPGSGLHMPRKHKKKKDSLGLPKGLPNLANMGKGLGGLPGMPNMPKFPGGKFPF